MSDKRCSDNLDKADRTTSLLKRPSATSATSASDASVSASDASVLSDLLTLQLLVEHQRRKLRCQEELILQLQHEKQLQDQEQQRLLLQTYREQQLRLHSEARLQNLEEQLRLPSNQLKTIQELVLEPTHPPARMILPKPKSLTSIATTL
ncbi:MAG: hypothetical protein Q8P67_16335 [archaeon]|nr:hypothetical protein [archaeon]